MHWKTLALIVTSFLLAGSTFLASAGEGKDKDKNKAAAKERKALQGTWTATKGDAKIQMVFDGNKFSFEIKGKTVSGTYTLDPTKKPKTIDMLVAEGSDEDTKKFKGKTAKCIYELDGTKFKWNANEPGGDERPEAFPLDGDKQNKHLYVVFERAKK
jgi:uncharacterized protein (TIGR03067 family)